MHTILTRKSFRRWLPALLLAFSSTVFALGPEALFAPRFRGDGQTIDWRIINKDEAAKNPWTAIGNFLIPGLGGYCSAVLVAPRIVLTANHCLYAADYRKLDAAGNPTKQLMDAKSFVFVAGVHDDSFADMIPVAEVITGGWEPGSEATAKDWAIAILARPASADIVPVALRPYALAEITAAWTNKLVVAAYPGASVAFSAVLRFSFNCSLMKGKSANIMTTNCQAEGGSSGAPILVEEGGKLRLIGIHSSTRSLDSRSSNGVSINGFLAQINDAMARFGPIPLARAADDLLLREFLAAPGESRSE